MIFFWKALHVIGFVSWFAGLFYLVRIFVYHAEAMNKPQPEQDILKQQFNIMEWRVYKIILMPALIITWVAGTIMLVMNPAYFSSGTPGWMIVKLVLLVILSGYQGYCKQLIKKFEKGELPMSSTKFRFLNEFPTLILVAISFIAVQGKAGTLSYWKLILGIILFVGLLSWGVKAYKKIRERQATKA